ncbi:calcium-translocating P-type ATPase, PMCA-type [Weissella diestrammenae]|uniref:P-type Ca(2+) transporter n=1 Tax=Weissella diestrammenae TaxID=1162633 RepID=A0A7G9T6F8_9LACO|nr:calcium-translocating P-type ATPase, PMCA-type [Weissella diestrammenae]MCM0583266.1 calcium-translocating P-type ATPase, PMCA-type [Weissella diestrammenae]QNN75683.1 calcium-translocating P-type ATPase, PMCA-type [Weissella diestrammenae]
MADKLKVRMYQQDKQDVLKTLKTDAANGLTTTEAQNRLAQYGKNELQAAEQSTIFQKFVNQFKDFMIIVLIVAALIAAATGETVDAIIILAVVVLNAVFGVYQEYKADEAIAALKKMSAPNANVRRDNEVVTLPANDLVPGDIVLLEAGDVIPADMRLLESASLKIEEAALTGESVPVEKISETLYADDLPLGDRTNLAFMNSNVTYGRGLGVVTGTGMSTEVGNIAEMLETTETTKTPLQENLSKLGKSLTYLILVIAVIVFIVGMFRAPEGQTGNRVIDMLLTAISLAVAAIPEGLPAIVTITLALGTKQLTKKHALMRKLPAVETLGSTEIIGSDKTGTLTQNKMTVEKYYVDETLIAAETPVVGSAGQLADLLALNNDTKITVDGEKLGDPTETALITFNEKQHRDLAALYAKYPRVGEIPFDSERKLMTTVHPDREQFIITVKGAPDELLRRTTTRLQGGERVPMTDADLAHIASVNMTLAKDALRVLAFAFKKVDAMPLEMSSELVEQDLTFVGLVGMIDPERPEVAGAVAEARGAGIRTLMITGDHKITAEAIARRLGILSDEQGAEAIITGAELDQLDDATFKANVAQYSVYARVAPEHKVRIVQAWQAQNKVVAMTGDGVNDAPALKTADIGVAMGITGTEVSKGAADMVLADDNFATIVNAVEEGRKVFTNIQKSIQYLLSANLGEVLTLFVMTIAGWNILAPVHILWINLITDTLPAIALGMEPTEPGIMKRQPRGRNSDFLGNGLGGAIVYQGLLEGLITLGVYWFGITFPVHTGAAAHADALTMAFATLGLIQLFHAFNTKSIYQSIFTVGIFKNKMFNWSILIAGLALAATILIPGLNDMFHVTHLDSYQWFIVLGSSFAIVPLVEIVKLVQRLVMKQK